MHRTADRREPAAAFDVVVLVTSAGGLEAMRSVLRELPADFPAAIVAAQHLGGQGSALVEILSRQSNLPVAWATSGEDVTPGRVLVSPPRRLLEILPDGTCAVGDTRVSAHDRPLDLLLQSAAETFGPRALAIVLTGMGRDAAAGAAAVRRGGGIVFAQSEDTAEQPSMPRAAIDAGAVDLVLPLHEIGTVLADVVGGGELPRSRAEIEAATVLFSGEGEVRHLLRTTDWSRTPLGRIAGWPMSLQTTLHLVLESSLPMCLLWGDGLIQLYNDEYRLLMRDKHPAAFGQSSRDSWPEVWHLNEPIFKRIRGGESVALRDALYPITRRGAIEDAWFDLSFTPVRDETRAVAGVLAVVVETTARVLSQRRLRTLQAVTAASTGSASVHVAMQRALALLAGSSGTEGTAQDVPFALGFLLDERSRHAQLVAAAGVEPGSPMGPRTVDVRAGHPAWPLSAVMEGEGSTLLLDDLGERFRGSRVGPNGESPHSAILMPLRVTAGDPSAGVLVCGLNPRLPLDDTYRAFLELLAARVSASLTEAQIRARERERAERLAEIDRAKTEFFSNVSHEFRTPLTLLLGPLEELARRPEQIPKDLTEDIQLAARNARRLLNQVNSLLDFSRAEARQLRARFEPTNLATLTRDIASVFRSAAERAGLTLRLDCPPLDEPVWVDPQMFEKIVSNLLSNALKFTFAGEIVVELHPRARHAELVVRDTGIGIPREERARIFTRFHRVPGHRGRTTEGSGIGLALVHELVRMHHGRVRVDGVEGRGTTFTIWIPMGRRPQDGLQEPADIRPLHPHVAAALADEAATWATPAHGTNTAAEAAPRGVFDGPFGPPLRRSARSPAHASVLIVDDHADMRAYLARLLKHWDVSTAADVTSAIAAIASARPDVIVADVMMPGADGFELLKWIRNDDVLKYTPVVLVSARAGEEATIEGLQAGADDYVAKPFSPRELVARVDAVLERSRVEAALRDRAAWLRGQREALEAALANAPLATCLAPLVRATVQAMGDGSRAAFFLADDAGTTLHHLVGMPDDYALAVAGFKTGPEWLACGLTSAGPPVITPDVMTDPRCEPWRGIAAAFDYRGCWSFPIHSAGERFMGTLAIYSRQPRDITERDRELASLLTHTAAIVIARHRDLLERQQAMDALREEFRNTQMLHDLSARLVTAENVQSIYEEVLSAAIDITRAKAGTVQVLDRGNDELVVLATRGFSRKTEEYFHRVDARSHTSCGLALRTGQRSYFNFDPASTDVSARLHVNDGVLSAQSSPLVSRSGKAIGMVSTHWGEPDHRPSERELRFLDLLARQAADLIEQRAAD